MSSTLNKFFASYFADLLFQDLSEMNIEYISKKFGIDKKVVEEYINKNVSISNPKDILPPLTEEEDSSSDEEIENSSEEVSDTLSYRSSDYAQENNYPSIFIGYREPRTLTFRINYSAIDRQPTHETEIKITSQLKNFLDIKNNIPNAPNKIDVLVNLMWGDHFDLAEFQDYGFVLTIPRNCVKDDYKEYNEIDVGLSVRHIYETLIVDINHLLENIHSPTTYLNYANNSQYMDGKKLKNH